MTWPAGTRVVLVDDSSELRLLLRELLTERGCEIVAEAADGREGIDAVGRVACDLVVMDLQMPDVDGAEATERIRAAHPGVEVVGFSASGDDEAAGRMRRAGATRHFSKTDYSALVDYVAAGRAAA